MDTYVDPGDLQRHLPVLLESCGTATVDIDVLTIRESFQGGEVSSQAQAITGPAREEHRRRHFGFWEYVLSQVANTDGDTRRGLIQGALRHNSDDTVSMRLSTSEFSEALARQYFQDLPDRTIISLSSRIETNAGHVQHLPMLDMGAPIDDGGIATCVDAVSCLGLSGQLYESGRSYHFIGDQPVEFDALLALLARAQLLSPIVDARWVSHQLVDGHAALRISNDLEKHSKPHRLVAMIPRSY